MWGPQAWLATADPQSAINQSSSHGHPQLISPSPLHQFFPTPALVSTCYSRFALSTDASLPLPLSTPAPHAEPFPGLQTCSG